MGYDLSLISVFTGAGQLFVARSFRHFSHFSDFPFPNVVFSAFFFGRIAKDNDSRAFRHCVGDFACSFFLYVTPFLQAGQSGSFV